MEDGEILRGNRWTALPLHGKNGTLLYATAVSMSCSIVISWTGGTDIDVCSFYSHYPSASVGWSHGGSIDTGDGFTASWAGDNTSGGPENITLAYQGARGIAGKSFEIHANWYSTGSDSGGGDVTVTTTDGSGNVKSMTFTPAHTKHKAAQPGNPGVRIIFNYDGTVKSITAA